MDIYGILAHPVEQSLSPTMHNAAFKALDIDAEYDFFDIKPEELADFLQKVRNEHIKGLSVSTPHKETIMDLIDGFDDFAKTIGAVNTITNIGGKLHGTNVDWIGVQNALQEITEIEDKTALVLGAGGAARAAVFGLKKADAAEIIILNRTVEHAKELAEEFGCKYGGIEEFANHKPEIVVQATSAGLNDPEGIEIIPKSLLSDEMVVMEMIYNPLMTKILKDAKEVGAKIITGDKMLLHQGFAAFQTWTGEKAPKEIMENAVHEHLSTDPA